MRTQARKPPLSCPRRSSLPHAGTAAADPARHRAGTAAVVIGLLTVAAGAGLLLLRPAGRAAAAASATATPTLTANDILRAVRQAQAHQREQRLLGQLRTGTGQVYPFLLTSAGSLVRYQFQPPAPALGVQVRLSDETSQLEVISANGNEERLTPVNFDKKVLDTDLTYEDLALRFIYWSRAQIEGEETVRTLPCWKLRLLAPTRRSSYANVFLWIDKANGSLMSAEGYDWDGHLIKRFEVISGQKIDGLWYLKQMRIVSLDPTADGRVRSRTYFEIKGLATK